VTTGIGGLDGKIAGQLLANSGAQVDRHARRAASPRTAFVEGKGGFEEVRVVINEPACAVQDVRVARLLSASQRSLEIGAAFQLDRVFRTSFNAQPAAPTGICIRDEGALVTVHERPESLHGRQLSFLFGCQASNHQYVVGTSRDTRSLGLTT
jgi:hypothetical protein